MMDSLSFEQTSLQYLSNPPSSIPSACSSPDSVSCRDSLAQKEDHARVLPSSDRLTPTESKKRLHDDDGGQTGTKVTTVML